MPLLGSASMLLASAGPFNEATGGTITTYVVAGRRYRLHSWETAGSFDFVVRKTGLPYRLAYVGAGGGGGGSDGTYAGGGGDGGYGGDVAGISLATGTFPIVVGAGSTGTGGTTTALGYTGNGGAGGADGNFVNQAAGTTRGPTSNIEDGVTTLQYGIGGQEGSPPASSYVPNNGHGADGNYPGGGVVGRVGSFPGAVWITYEVKL